MCTREINIANCHSVDCEERKKEEKNAILFYFLSCPLYFYMSSVFSFLTVDDKSSFIAHLQAIISSYYYLTDSMSMSRQKQGGDDEEEVR